VGAVLFVFAADEFENVDAAGACIGCIAGGELYLASARSYEVAQQTAGTERLQISEQTLRHRLHSQGLLAGIDAGRQTLQVRRTLEGCPRQVLHLKARDLAGDN